MQARGCGISLRGMRDFEKGNFLNYPKAKKLDFYRFHTDASQKQRGQNWAYCLLRGLRRLPQKC